MDAVGRRRYRTLRTTVTATPAGKHFKVKANWVRIACLGVLGL
ncbi:MAG TPA: hypothetical protein VGP04_09555 [Pseudonocardiaceae bacterium]|nr:hypothetical protein [Pseudonocardiaceae bacterium]